MPPPDPTGTPFRREGSERISRGSVGLPGGGEWYAELSVPAVAQYPLLLTVGRRGAGASLEPREAALVIPQGEAAALLSLVQGVLEQARADGLLREDQL